MRHEVWTVFDSAAGFYMPPFYARSKGEAIRSFRESANDDRSNIKKYADQFTLFHLGFYDDATAAFDPLPAPMSFGTALEYQNRT